MSYDVHEFAPDDVYSVEPPKTLRPIVILGAGGIVRDAHLPAYSKAGFPVAGIYNRTAPQARALADEYGIPTVSTTIAEAVAAAPADAVFDIALMPEQFLDALDCLPDGAAVLIQKPLGNKLSETADIVDLCRTKHLVAAVNTQLRFAPYVAEARRLIASGAIGELYDFEIQVEVNTPWEMFPHVIGLDRLEITAHSVHYLDLARSFFGNPDRVSATTVRHPLKNHASSRSTLLLHYDDRPLRVIVSTNHDHRFGPRHEQSFIKWEGTSGAIYARMGLLLDYPRGRSDALEMIRDDETDWVPVPFEGSWFPDAFAGSMGALLRFLDGSAATLPTRVEDVYDTMALVESAYASDERGGIRPAYLLGSDSDSRGGTARIAGTGSGAFPS